jgi:hypothetical protein
MTNNAHKYIEIHLYASYMFWPTMGPYLFNLPDDGHVVVQNI